MRTIAKVLTAVSALTLAGAAYAADLPTRKAPAAPAPIEPPSTWGGFYVGAFAGGNWSSSRIVDTSGALVIPTINANGLTAGGLAGYNLQFQQFVLGGEGEFGYDRRKGSVNYLTGAGAARTTSENGTFEGRIRGRVGYTMGPVLLYVAGGLSVADLQLTPSVPATGASTSLTHTSAGFNIGGGLEYMFAQHWVVRGEYIYDNYGTRNYVFLPLANGFDNRSAHLQESTARVALTYKF